MFRFIFIAVLSVIVLIVACDDSSVSPGNSALFYVTVVDTLGNPVENLRVESLNHSDYLYALGKKLPPATTINFTLVEPGPYNLFILNYYNDIVEHYSGDGNSGSNTVVWDSYGSLSGFYKYVLYIGEDTTNPAYYAEKNMVLENYPTPAIVGYTDSDGVLYTNDTLLFPCLLGEPPVIYYTDQYGNPIDTVYDFYNDSVTIYLRDTLTLENVYYVKPLQVGPNNFELLWDPGIHWQNP